MCTRPDELQRRWAHRPGNNICEIGAGTGDNAGNLAELTGPAGHVTTIDIDAEVTAQARKSLDANGSSQVEVITRDGSLGAPAQVGGLFVRAKRSSFDRLSHDQQLRVD